MFKYNGNEKIQTVIRLLKKELKVWKEKQASDKIYYKGEEKDKNAIRAFKENKKNIEELEEAILILKYRNENWY